MNRLKIKKYPWCRNKVLRERFLPSATLIVVTILFGGMLLTACNSHLHKPVQQTQTTQKAQKIPKKHQTVTVYPSGKVKKPVHKPETVILDGQEYIIPAPWKGHRLSAPKFEYSDFSQIPVEFTHNGSKVYILDNVQQPLVRLMQAAEKDGILLQVESAYRSERYQKKIFKRMISENRTFDDIIRYVAPPGYSQHMLGTAVDFYPSNWRFADTEAYPWLQKNAGSFGFEETYSEFNPMHMPWEAWHWNYTGKINGEKVSSSTTPIGTLKKSQ